MPVSFDLTEDQLELQKWVHEFSANVVRPAAAEYDEREDFPWPVLQ
jgi:alkylation response protein AidB-like acyl-CoA dehydrogenase